MEAKSSVPLSEVELPVDGVRFKHFIALNSSQTCVGDEHALPFNNQIRGVNLGGWMVLEPWITPSLFYQFLGGNETTTAFDTSTFCKVLGPKEANRQLRQHWEAWVTEDIVRKLAYSGAVNSLRLPVGDYMYTPYGPYATREEGVACFDGALEYVDQLLDWAYAYGLTVLIDIHAIKDSQNGFDNSGQAMGMSWTTDLNSDFSDSITFEHWPIRSAAWMGEFDPDTASYPEINYENIEHALDVVSKIAKMYGNHRAVLGLEPVNEPWQFTPIEELKNFYWEGYLRVKKHAPYWKYIMHDSFRLDPNIWGGFMDGCPERALDTHIYQAWRDPDSRIGFYNDACGTKGILAEIERTFGPVIVGEWSLATDNCAMWLNGFNDNLPGFPRLPCKYIKCSAPYMGDGQPGAPVDPTKPMQGPFGTGMSGPIFGLCPVGRDWLKESSGDPQTGHDWVRAPPEAPRHLDDTDNVMRHLAEKKINAFSGVGHGFYFWNFRTDMDEPYWSYMLALERGWIPNGNLGDDRITNACYHEDRGDFKCILKKEVNPDGVRGAVKFILDAENRTNSDEGQEILSTPDGDDFDDIADGLIQQYFAEYRSTGATCDFGGIAMLVEENRTIDSNDKEYSWLDDDEYFPSVVYRGPSTVELILIIILASIFGSLIGFIVAMRTSKHFNRRVRESSWFKPLSKSNSKVLRSSLGLPELANYDELEQLVDDDERNSNKIS
eukprot:CAMPEP_0119560032 /NCGR_PEP_ID=MMETSP1352-20130426/13834_1 /TAXON_ID=265584 /ORGANISM="Stauroneis constricta, Strain CCMP1120" /LENGTH=719 /DNA_ID=CAMNT_0007607897 /DNA_START=138 /DNA_END=2300 /DNA_ORIENTATION=-